ncbi:MAG TPA: 2-C-methyl-D-erythritol 4-phosphate cytidylyltransferase [Acidimicrobiales bacterium]|nr:2-C-methyl-D-erythritol 4-phosphate cytidylyltransferase [Acidimicrobiales bacterium]
MVVAAGGGSRFGGRKQFAMIRGRPMLEWAVAASRSAVDGVVLVLPPGEAHVGTEGCFGADVVVAGGDSRSASVRAGLGAVPEEASVVVVHDGARPLATPALFATVVRAIDDGADAVVPAVAVADTVKRVRAGAVVGSAVREELMAVQTPQAFRAEVLRRAHVGGGEASDDAGLVEALGVTVRVVEGEQRNLKVTTPADLELVQAMAGS